MNGDRKIALNREDAGGASKDILRMGNPRRS